MAVLLEFKRRRQFSRSHIRERNNMGRRNRFEKSRRDADEADSSPPPPAVAAPEPVIVAAPDPVAVVEVGPIAVVDPEPEPAVVYAEPDAAPEPDPVFVYPDPVVAIPVNYGDVIIDAGDGLGFYYLSQFTALACPSPLLYALYENAPGMAEIAWFNPATLPASAELTI